MGTTTTNLALYKPAVAENGWGLLVNANFDTLDVLIPPGVMLDYGGTTAPTGWLLCDGTAVSRTTFARLFAAVGTAYGAGNGSTTFNVPDCRGRVTVGVGTHADVNATAKSDGLSVGSRRPKHKHTVANTSHTHTVNDPGHTHSYDVSSSAAPLAGGATANLASTSPSTTGAANTGMTVNSATVGLTVGPQTGSEPTDSEAYLVVNKIVKT